MPNNLFIYLFISFGEKIEKSLIFLTHRSVGFWRSKIMNFGLANPIRDKGIMGI